MMIATTACYGRRRRCEAGGACGGALQRDDGVRLVQGVGSMHVVNALGGGGGGGATRTASAKNPSSREPPPLPLPRSGTPTVMEARSWSRRCKAGSACYQHDVEERRHRAGARRQFDACGRHVWRRRRPWSDLDFFAHWGGPR
uniref:Uncharacterized protein n=1 Tax=Arundo donax TaxID=35708 RepID=A0A0A8XVA7_ARUDO